ncbi:MAG: response regulator [Gemmatimonadetes bacterium]|nr:response regulator [Gemmatimonadota bacterium]MYG15993.1 response regulator [Gemmatimonadota bacterium]MYH20227.1 response regulator [Gemmatimonadota bacterium]MYK97236.1 response regulator [Gemmatimonadota bacterium]
MRQTILVVDDEPDIVEIIQYNLEKSGFDVIVAADGPVALEKARDETPDLIVLDLMLPGLEGTDVCRILKQDERTRSIPILMLTAKSEEIDRIIGLELGADDYVVKPFSPREIALRIRNILRRRTAPETPGPVRAGPLVIDVEGHHVSVSGSSVSLTATEFKLLAVLFQRRGRVQSREELLDVVWGYDYMGYGRTVDAHIKRLREKLGEAAGMVETVRGVGYRFAR